MRLWPRQTCPCACRRRACLWVCRCGGACPGATGGGACGLCGRLRGGVLCIQPLAGAFSFLLSAGAGAGLCALLPAGWLMPALKEDDPPGDERPRLSAAATRLEAVAESLSSLAETVNEVYDAFPRRCEGFRWVIDNIHDGLCANCGRREVCWKQEHASTLEGMEALRPILEEKGHLEAALLPGQLARCIHPAALCAAGDKAFALYRSRREAASTPRPCGRPSRSSTAPWPMHWVSSANSWGVPEARSPTSLAGCRRCSLSWGRRRWNVL